MANFLALKLALRFVRSRRKGALTRFISFASTCGIAIGVFAAIVGFSAMNGFEYELEHRVLSIIPSAQLNSSQPYFNDSDDIERVLREDPHVLATAPAVEQRAILTANRAFVPLLILGIQPDKETQVIDIQRFVSTDLHCLSPNYDGSIYGICNCEDVNQGLANNNTAADSADSVDSSAAVTTTTAAAVAGSGTSAATGAEADGNEVHVKGTLDNDKPSASKVIVATATNDLNQEQDADIEQLAMARAASSGSDAYTFYEDGYDSVPASELPRIVIGSGIAKKLQVDVGDTVDMVTLDNQSVSSANKAGKAEAINRSLRTPEKHKALVVGIIHIGGQLDTTVALMDFNVISKIAQIDGPNVVHIKIDDLLNTNTIVYEATSGKIKESAYLVTWMSSQGKLYHDIQMVRQIMFVAMFLVLAVACFNIVSNLLMMVGEKRREIAILLTMGMKPRDVVRTFSIMGLISGGYGAMLGLVSGVVVSLLITPITSSFREWFGFDLLNEDVYFINFIPCQLNIIDVVLVMAISLLMSWGAALYPALRAAHIKPARELNL